MFDTMVESTTSVFIILVLASQFGLSIQTCSECTCCAGENHNCDSNRNCNNGCIDGYYGSKCTEKCLENCKTCVNGTKCTECKPGYYTHKCSLPCGKGCVNNTCLISSGECTCTSFNFIDNNKCDVCKDLKYGDDCNNTCPTNCGSCLSDTECPWCKNTVYYGSYCQYRCSVGCVHGKCNKGTGYCLNGCKPGYIGDKCDTCLPGIYGNYCDLHCLENCSACFSATNCTECKTGFYGERCTNTCPSGCYGNCSRTDGRCFECKPGFVGEYCDPCRNRTYGVNCSKFCHEIDPHCQVCSTNESGIYQGCTKCDNKHYLVTPYGYNFSICKNCSTNCAHMVCNNAGLCTKGCVRGKWGIMCNTECAKNCELCDKHNGTCLKCNHNAFSHNCLKNCSTNCNNTDNGRACTRDTGKCLHGCKSMTNYGEHCENNCSKACNNESCDWKSGHCLYGCKDGFYGEKCDKKCSSHCVNATCNKVTAACSHGCVDGYEGLDCVLAIKGADLEEKKPLVVIAGSAGAGVVVIVLLLILVICLIKRNRRQKLSSNTKCEENDYVLDMKEIPKQIDEDEPGVIYAKPFKPNQEAGGAVGKEYDTAYDGDKIIPAIDNGYTAVNIGTSANEKSKCFAVCDIAHDNKPLSGNNNYAVVNKGMSTVKENECSEEVYDTTHDNTKNKQPLSSNNDYAVLSVRSDNTKGFGKSNLTQPDDVYDSAEGGKHNTMSHPSNDYAVLNSNNGDKHGNDKANTLYDTATDKKMRPGINDYDFCELDTT